MALIASTSSPTYPNGCWTRSFARRLSPVTVAACALSLHPSLAGAAYALQPPQGGFPSPCGLGSARRSSAGSGFVNAHHHRTGEHEMPFPSPTNSATLIGKLTRDPELRTVSTKRRREVRSDSRHRRPQADQDRAGRRPDGRLLRRDRLGATGRDMRRPPGEGTPGRSLRTPRTNLMGDGRRRKAPRHGGHRRCGRVPGPPPPRHGLLRAAVPGRGRRCVAGPAACPPLPGAGTRPLLLTRVVRAGTSLSSQAGASIGGVSALEITRERR
jgi:hypothetical protein